MNHQPLKVHPLYTKRFAEETRPVEHRGELVNLNQRRNIGAAMMAQGKALSAHQDLPEQRNTERGQSHIAVKAVGESSDMRLMAGTSARR